MMGDGTRGAPAHSDALRLEEALRWMKPCQAVTARAIGRRDSEMAQALAL